jgi:hypothetical protein
MGTGYTNGDATDIILDDGLAYAVRHFTDGDDMQDEKTGRLWDEAATALDALVDHLHAQTGRDELKGI